MRKILRTALAALLLSAMLLTVAGCSNNELKESSEWKDSPNLVSRNKELAHIPLSRYTSIEDALAETEDSSYTLSLNGEWQFSLVETESDIPSDFQSTEYDAGAWGSINVPGNWETQGYSMPTYIYQDYPWDTVEFTAPSIPEENEIGLYRRTITVPEEWKDRETYISFEGVESACYVYVNGKMAGYGEDSYTSKDFRITSLLEYGKENVIAVKVFKYCDGSWLEAQDGLKMGGIYRDVFLYSAPKTQIKDVYFDIQMQQNFTDAITKVSVNVGAYGDIPTDSYVTFRLYDAENSMVFEDDLIGAKLAYKEDLTGGAHLAETSERIAITNLHTWTADDPYLYTGVITLFDKDGNVLDMITDKIGFRDVGFSTDEQGIKTFTINGVPLKLYGVVYNETSAVGGKTVTLEEMRQDILMMKQLNINAVRSPGQPFSADFIDLCDEYGLYVVSDVNLSTYPWSRKGAQTIPGDQAIWQTAVLDRLVNVLERDKNNSSVIMWALGSQSGNGTNFTQMKNWLIENESRMILYDAYIDESDASYTSYSTEADIIAATNWDLDKLNDLVNDTENTKPIIIQEFDNGLLNSAGNVDSMVEIIDNSPNIQGGFLANWADRAIYLPIDSENALSVVRDTPYSSNPELYQLTYAASWTGFETSEEQVALGKYSLSGIVNADRTLQSDALQFKNAYAPISVTPDDVKSGLFTVKNRNTFKTFEDNYEITYEVFSGTQSVKTGVVSGLTLAAGEEKQITLDYGSINSGDWFVTVTVKYLTTPTWAVDIDGYDMIVSEAQYDINGNTSPVKGGGETSVSGQALTLNEFRAPVVQTSAIELASGKVYITNNSSKPLDDLYTLSYQVIETNNFWASPKPVIYAEGVISSTGIPANADYAEIQLPYEVNAIEEGSYFVNVILTAKTAIGDIPAGYELITTFTAASLGVDSIPFYIDKTRTPVPQVDQDGNQIYDSNGVALWEEGVGEYAPSGNEIYYEEKEEAEIPEDYLSLENDKVKIEFDVTTGLITSFVVDGKNVFAEAGGDTFGSPVGSAYRTPTGGDYTSDAAEQTNLNNLKLQSFSSGEKTLLNDVSAVKIDDSHYRLSLDYIITDHDESVSYADEFVTRYSIVYDVYSNGILSVSVAYELSSDGEIPLQLANILTISGSYTNMTWYGRGPGETYPDKLYNSKVDIYETPISSVIGEYLMETGSGNRSEVRWAAFTGEDGAGILITSDDTNFSFDVSKVYPWETVAYSRDVSSRENTVLSIIGAQCGSDSGKLNEQIYKTESHVITPGSKYSFSYRIVPLSSVDDAQYLSSQTLSSAGKADIEYETVSAGSLYAIQNFASDNQYVTSTGSALNLSAGLGGDNQIFITEKNSSSSKDFALKSLANGLYLSPMGTNAEKTSIEVGFASSITYDWQKWSLSEGELAAVNTSYSLTALAALDHSGSHIALQLSEKRQEAAWTLSYDVNDDTRVMIKNNMTGLYLTVVDNMTFTSPLVQALDVREFSYPPSVNWNMSLSSQQIVYDAGDFVSTSGHITQWEILPNSLQKWQFIDAGNGNFSIFNPVNGTYLGVREDTVAGTQEKKPVLVEYNPENLDEQTASTVWRVENRNGLFSIINTDFNLALQSNVQRTKMTSEEMDYEYITDVENAFKDVYVLSVGEWANLPTQKWDLKSEEDLRVNVTAGENWFKTEVEES